MTQVFILLDADATLIAASVLSADEIALQVCSGRWPAGLPHQPQLELPGRAWKAVTIGPMAVALYQASVSLGFRSPSNARLSLSPRQRQVIDLLGQGLTAEAIAARLGISVHTVRYHIACLKRRLAAPVHATMLPLLMGGGEGR